MTSFMSLTSLVVVSGCVYLVHVTVQKLLLKKAQGAPEQHAGAQYGQYGQYHEMRQLQHHDTLQITPAHTTLNNADILNK